MKIVHAVLRPPIEILKETTTPIQIILAEVEVIPALLATNNLPHREQEEIVNY